MDWIWVLAVALFGLGSVPSPPDPDPPGLVPSELVVRWTQATYEELPSDLPAGEVVDTEAEREAFLGRLPAGLPVAAVEQVDLSSSVLVVGGYHSCQQSSYVVRTPAGPALAVTEIPEGLACEWSPYTLDVRAVAR